jgi:hypothetical protein
MSKGGVVALRFLFANHDGVSVTLEFPLETTAEAVKQAMLANWPASVEKVGDVRRFRLLCMGKELETCSTKSLKSLNIPVYEHPTPVNVSVLPKTFATPAQEKKVDKDGMPTAPPPEACCELM